MAFNQPIVFLFLCGAIVLLSTGRLRVVRRQIFLIASLGFVALFYFAAGTNSKANPGWLAFLAVFIAVHYLALQTMLRLRSATIRSAVYYGWFAATIASFLVVKQYDWLTAWLLPGSDQLLQRVNLLFSRGDASLPIVTLGLSFLIFRQIHMAVEVRDGMLKNFSLLDYFSYLLAFWTFNAGPIQRFEPFCLEFQGLSTNSRSASTEDVLIGLNRVMFGYLKMFVISAWFSTMATPDTYTRHPDLQHLVRFLLAYPLFMYMNFTGYCDIVIGVARTVGFTLPENFNRPLLARNMVDYWNRWHMTLSAFFRDYMYLPIYSALRRRVPQLLAMSITSMLAFLVMGIWHDKTAMMAVFGLFHGAGVVITNLYGELLKKMLTREQLKRYRQNRIIHLLAVMLCQCYVVAAFLFFAYDWEQLSRVCRCLLQYPS